MQLQAAWRLSEALERRQGMGVTLTLRGPAIYMHCTDCCSLLS